MCAPLLGTVIHAAQANTIDGWGYSPPDQIDRANVGDLRMVWTRVLAPGSQQALTNTMYMPLRNVCAQMIAEGPESTSIYAINWRPEIAPGTDQVGAVWAISAETGETAWVHEQRAATMSLVATGGGLVFGGDVNGRFRAFDQETGEVLWEVNLGSSVSGFPITYAVDGRQYVAVSTGTQRFVNLTPELSPSQGNNLFVFGLP